MKAAVLERIGQPLTIRDLEMPALQQGQVLVKMLCTGICGSQLQEVDGLKGDPANCPHLLGHEGCGIVEESGIGVTHVKSGDKVVLHWRKGVGVDAALPIFGDVKAGPCTTFSEYTVVSENRVTPIPKDVPNDLASLLGCCLSTALAIVENEACPKLGEEVAIIGCGGVGLALILAAKMTRANVVGIDRAPEKSLLVESLGARVVNGLELKTYDAIIDTVKNSYPASCRKYISLQLGGTQAGGFNPTRDIPRYIQMWREGKLQGWEKLITHRISLEKINEGIQLMRDGKAGRVLIEFT